MHLSGDGSLWVFTTVFSGDFSTRRATRRRIAAAAQGVQPALAMAAPEWGFTCRPLEAWFVVVAMVGCRGGP